MAERSGFDGVLNSSTDGKPMAGVLWTVYNADGSQATIYENKTGGSLKPNGIEPTDETGLIKFWADPGYYEILVTDSNTPERFVSRRIPFNAVAGDVGGIHLSQLPAIPGSKLLDHSVTGSKIENSSVDGAKLKFNNVKGDRISDNSIDGNKITINTVDGNRIKSNTLHGASLINSSLPEEKISSNAISSSKLQSNSVIESKISNLAVTNNKLASDAVSGSKIQNGAVSGSKIQNGAVSRAKLAPGAVGYNEVEDLAIGEAHIRNESVTTAKISPLSINNYRVANDAKISLAKLADVPPGQIPVGDSGSRLRAQGVTGDASLSSSGVLTIGPGAVTPSKLADGAVGTDKIANYNITRNKIFPGTLKTIRTTIYTSTATTGGTHVVNWSPAFASNDYHIQLTAEDPNLIVDEVKVHNREPHRFTINYDTRKGGTFIVHVLGIEP